MREVKVTKPAKPILRGQARDRARVVVTEGFLHESLSIEQLADVIGRRRSLVRNLLAEAGIRETRKTLIGTDKGETGRSLAVRYAQGQSLDSLARTTGMARKKIREMLVEAGTVLRTHRPLNHDEVEQVRAQYETGASIRQIAASLDSTYGTIRTALLDGHVTLRSQGGARARRRQAAD
jgi:hypothetical protein